MSWNDRPDQLEAVLACLLDVFDGSVVAVYQFGSAVMGGLRPLSDLDVLAVVERASTAAQRRRLVHELMPLSGNRSRGTPGRPVEVTVIRHETARRWHEGAVREFQYGEWLRADYEAGVVPEPEADPDLAPLLATVLAASQPLTGPPADAVIAPIPHDRLVDAMRRAIPALVAELATDTTNVLLTLARMMYTASTGLIASKDAAAAWARERLPADLRSPLEYARSVYLGDLAPEDAAWTVTPTATAEFMAHVVLDA